MLAMAKVRGFSPHPSTLSRFGSPNGLVRGLRFLALTLFFSVFVPSFAKLWAEGTKELAPGSSDVTMLYTIEPTFGSFATYNGASSSRLYIHISDPSNEQVYLGFSQQASTSNGSDGNLVTTNYYFRIKDPSGNVVYGPQLVNNTTANANTWNLASAGPAPVVGASGYTPFTFNPAGLAAGDYYVEFSGNATTATTASIAIKYWDITVATKGASPQALNGRLWSQRWSLRTPSISQGTDPTYTYYDRPFNGQVYLYTFDGFVSKVDFNNSGFRGLSFNLAYNETGTATTADFEVNRKSVAASNNTLPLFKIFINNPDAAAYPSGTIGEVSTAPVVLNCDLSNLCIAYSVSEPGYVFILLDFDTTTGAGLYDQSTADVLLYEKVEPAPNESPPYSRCASWDGLNGLGASVNLSSAIPLYFTYAQGLVHFPVYDVEYNINGFNVVPVRPLLSGFVQEIYYDDGNIAALPGNGKPKVEVNGCTPPCHNYSNFSYGDLNTLNTWWYTSQDFQISFEPSDSILHAYNDIASTPYQTPVVIDVLGNDLGVDLDEASVSTTGLLQPGSGVVTVNTSTGEVTYTPVAGFVGTDYFEYRVCELGGSPCDTALVEVTVACASGAGNTIKGAVFNDVDGDGAVAVGEPGQAGVTVTVYQDNNANGLVDGGDTALNTQNTDANGEYAFTVTPTFSAVVTQSDAPSGGLAISNATPCATPIVRTFTITDNMTITDVDLGFNASHVWRGDIRVSLQSPAGTTVQLINGGSNDQSDNYDLLLNSASSNALNDGNNDDVNSPYYDRSAGPANTLNAFNGQNAQGVWTLRVCDTYPSTDNGTYNRSQLSITGQRPGDVHYVLSIDTTDLPCGASLSTDNVEAAAFTAAAQADCANNFGFELSQTTAVAGSNGPVCAGGTINLTETGVGAVAWAWSGPDGFTSSLHNPSIANATTAKAGSYSVTVTDVDGCTKTNNILVVVNTPVNAGTALANGNSCLEGSGLSVIDLFSQLSGENPGGTWSVVIGSPGALFNAGAGTLNPNGLPIGFYTFRYTVAGSPPCPSDTEDWSITVARCCPAQVCLPVAHVRNN